MKAMILAAGKGTRMGELTAHTPKPLLKVGSLTLIEHKIKRLTAAGFTDIVINTAYKGELIQDLLGDGTRYGIKIAYSDEGEEPIGPGAGIAKALPLLGDSHFLVTAADVFSNYPLQQLHQQTQQLAHLVLVPNPDFHPQGDYGINDRFLTHELPKYTYAGYSIWHPSLFHTEEQGGLGAIIDRVIIQQAITAELYHGAWHNIGTPRQLSELSNDLV